MATRVTCPIRPLYRRQVVSHRDETDAPSWHYSLISTSVYNNKAFWQLATIRLSGHCMHTFHKEVMNEVLPWVYPLPWVDFGNNDHWLWESKETILRIEMCDIATSTGVQSAHVIQCKIPAMPMSWPLSESIRHDPIYTYLTNLFTCQDLNLYHLAINDVPAILIFTVIQHRLWIRVSPDVSLDSC